MLFCQLWSCLVPIGVGCADTDKEACLTTCSLKMPICMPKSVNIGHMHLNTKICCMCGCGGSPPVNLVISGTE